jgi:hypothetical protein
MGAFQVAAAPVQAAVVVAGLLFELSVEVAGEVALEEAGGVAG